MIPYYARKFFSNLKKIETSQMIFIALINGLVLARKAANLVYLDM